MLSFTHQSRFALIVLHSVAQLHPAIRALLLELTSPGDGGPQVDWGQPLGDPTPAAGFRRRRHSNPRPGALRFLAFSLKVKVQENSGQRTNSGPTTARTSVC